jgi:type VI secretion system protein ImpB
MDDFSPAAIARKVEPLAKLLEARSQLQNLLTYMDGKTDAEKLVGQLLEDPALLSALAAAPKPLTSESSNSGHSTDSTDSTDSE